MRLYLDTSVLSALYDNRSPERRRLTEEFFAVIDQHDAFVSELTLAEIDLTPDDTLRSQLKERSRSLILLSGMEQEATELARDYVANEAVPSTYTEDAQHIATAVVHGMDALLSWNFRHIVRRKTRSAVNMVNTQRNLRTNEIMTPAELL